MRKDTCFRSFREVLSQFVTPQVWKQAHQAWHPAHSPSRWRLTPLVWVLLGMAWCCGDSLDERFATARAVFVASNGKVRRPGSTLQGFLQALERLPMPVLRALAKGVRERLGEQFVDGLRVNGWLPAACDGTRLECPRSKELQRWLDTAGKADAAPTVYLTAIVLLPLGLLWSWQWGKGTASEHYHLRRLLPTLPERTLLVADALYQGYELFTAITQAGAGFLVRLSAKSYLYTLDNVCLKRFREGIVYYWPEQKARDKGLPPIKARALRVRGKKGDVWLLTSILERAELSRKNAAQVYRWRWRNEGLFRQYKRMLKKTKLQSHTLRLLHREGEGALLALQLLLAHAAQAMHQNTWGEKTTDSPRGMLLRIRSVMAATLQLLGPRQSQTYRRMLEQIRSAHRRRTSSRTRQKWPRRKDHKPPQPPKLRTMDDKLKKLLEQHLGAA
jgi:Transposase DDE domain